jgi:sulfur-oxidizing protein SoxB
MLNLSKREFLQVLGAGSVAGMGLGTWAEADAATAANALYDIPRFGQVSFLHMTDCHAQLKPIHFREPSINLGIGSMKGNLPHLVGEHLLKFAKIRPGTAEAHALTYLDYEKAARRYGKVGGFAHLSTLVKRSRAAVPAPCCWTAETPGKARAPACGPTVRTWSTPASCWAWT